MPQWTKKILQDKKGEIKVSKLLDFIEVLDPKVAKAGEIVRFMHDAKEDKGLFYQLEGKILQRVTKASREKNLKYTENYFNIGKLRVINVWGEETKPLPSSVCTNLAPNFGWMILKSEGNLTNGGETAVRQELAAVPITRKEDDTDQGDDEDYHDSHTDINESIERKNIEEEIKGQTPIVGVESPKSTEQYMNDYVSKIEIG